MAAIVLAGHGSHVSPETAGAVHRVADVLRRRGAADEIAPCFWKEQPSFAEVLGTVAAAEVFVVPVFAARGFYAESVLPAEMALGQPRTDGKRVVRTAPLADHPFIERKVRQRLAEGCAALGVPAEDIAVALIGHGTPRHPGSRAKTEALAAALRAESAAGEAVAVFLDDAPEIPAAFDMTTKLRLLAIPVFMACGSHVTQDVPRELGLPKGEWRAPVRGRDLLYLPPAADDEQLADAIAELAWEAGLAKQSAPRGPWAGFPHAGAERFLEALAQRGTLEFGELAITTTEVSGPIQGGTRQTFRTPGELRDLVRGTQPDGGDFRYLASARKLPGDWRVPLSEPAEAAAVVEVVYPGCLARWRDTSFRPTRWEEFVARQLGMFAEFSQLPQAAREQTTADVCGGCIRTPAWAGQASVLRCGEPCNAWLTEAHRRTAKTSSPERP